MQTRLTTWAGDSALDSRCPPPPFLTCSVPWRPTYRHTHFHVAWQVGALAGDSGGAEDWEPCCLAPLLKLPRAHQPLPPATCFLNAARISEQSPITHSSSRSTGLCGAPGPQGHSDGALTPLLPGTGHCSERLRRPD